MNLKRRHLQRFPIGEACQECHARKWYLENGLRFCQNGHQIEGFVQYDNDDDDGRLRGRTQKSQADLEEAALEKAARKRLEGVSEQLLYVECLQLILRRQVAWMIQNKGLGPELETVVKDLWDLRIRGAPHPADAKVTQQQARELETFGSQVGGGSGSIEKKSSKEAGEPTHHARGQNWNDEEMTKWPTPALLDTIALVYLGVVLLRYPIRLGDIIKWANENQFPFKSEITKLPKDIINRISDTHLLNLKNAQRSHVVGPQVHSAVINLVVSYKLTYGIVFPSLETSIRCIQYLRDLSLPIELFPLLQRIISLTEARFEFPLPKPKIKTFDNPEIQLAATLGAIVKHFLPFDEPHGYGHLNLPLVNWSRWGELRSTQSSTSNIFTATTGIALANMSDVERSKHLQDILQEIDNDQGNSILQLFPTDEPQYQTSGTKRSTTNHETYTDHIAALEGATIFSPPSPESIEDLARTLQPRHTKLRDVMSTTATSFYVALADLCGIDGDLLVKAIDQVELRWLSQTERHRHSAEDQDSHSNDVETD